MTIVTNKNRKTGEDSKYVYCEIEVEGKCIDMLLTDAEAKRAIKGGGVRIDNLKITNPDLVFNSIEELKGKIIQIGKKITKRFKY